MTCRERHDELRSRGLDERPGVRANPRPAREGAENQGLEWRESVIRPLDRQDRLPGIGAVAVVEGMHGEGGPVVDVQLEKGNDLVGAAQDARYAPRRLAPSRGAGGAQEHLARPGDAAIARHGVPKSVDRQVERCGSSRFDVEGPWRESQG